MLRVLSCLFFIAFIAQCRAQVLGVGKCPEVEVVNDFDASKYVGLWYENQRYPLIFEFLGKCVTATYTAQPDGTIGVFNEQINSVVGNYQNINGTASFVGSPNEAKLEVVFPSVVSVKGNYWVLGTDYDSYAVVWACSQIGYLNTVSSWVLTREAFPSQETLDKAKAVIEKNKVPKQHYSVTDQTNCPKKQ